MHRASRAATPAARWAAGTARRSRRSPTSRASRCASAASPAWCMAKLGVVPQQIAGAATSIRRSRRARSTPPSGSGPYDDEKLGFNKVAKYYYYPGWWEGGPMLHMFINDEEVERAAEGVPGGARGGLRRGQHLDDGQVRRAEPAGAAPAGRERHAAAPVPAARSWRRATRRPTSSTPRSRAKNPHFKKHLPGSGRSSATSRSCGSASPRRRYDNYTFGSKIGTVGRARLPAQEVVTGLLELAARGKSPAAAGAFFAFCSAAEFRRCGASSLAGRLLLRCLRRLVRHARISMRRSGRRPSALVERCSRHQLREGDHERHHDELDDHERHRAPVDLAGGDRRSRSPVILSTYSLAARRCAGRRARSRTAGA